MSFIRTKNIGGNEYFYLVENKREGEKVKQTVLKYLGTTKPNKEELELIIEKEKEETIELLKKSVKKDIKKKLGTTKGKTISVGDLVKTQSKGKKMRREDIEESGLKIGDKILAVDPDSGAYRPSRKESGGIMTFRIEEVTISRIARNGIRGNGGAYDFLRNDGVWSIEEDEQN